MQLKQKNIMKLELGFKLLQNLIEIRCVTASSAAQGIPELPFSASLYSSAHIGNGNNEGSHREKREGRDYPPLR